MNKKLFLTLFAVALCATAFFVSCNNENNTFEIHATNVRGWQLQDDIRIGSIATVKAKNHNRVVLAEAPFQNYGFTLHLPNRLRNSLLEPTREQFPDMGIRRNVRDTALRLYAYNENGRRVGFLVFEGRGQESRIVTYWSYLNRNVVVIGYEKNERGWRTEVDFNLQRGWNATYIGSKNDKTIFTTERPAGMTFNWIFYRANEQNN